MLFWWWPCVFLCNKLQQVASLVSKESCRVQGVFNEFHGIPEKKQVSTTPNWPRQHDNQSALPWAQPAPWCATVPVNDTPPQVQQNKVFDAKFKHFKNRSGMTFALKSQTGKPRVKVKLKSFISHIFISRVFWWHRRAPVCFEAPVKINISRKLETQQLPPGKSTPKRLIKDRAYVPHDALYERRVGVVRGAIHLHDARNCGSPHPQCSFTRSILWSFSWVNLFSKPVILKVQLSFHVWSIGWGTQCPPWWTWCVV